MLVTKTCLLLAILFLATRHYVHCKHYNSIGGPFRVDVKRIEQCPDQMQGSLRATLKINKLRTKITNSNYFKGNLSFPYNVNDALSLRIMVSSWSNMGGWKDNAHNLDFHGFCTAMETMTGKFWLDYAISVFGEVSKCPYYAGEYHFENLTITFEKTAIKQFLYGRWRADAQVYSRMRKEVIGCIRAYADTVPI